MLGKELRTDYWARRIFERLSDKRVDRLFRSIDSRGIVNALGRSENLSFDWHGRVLAKMVRLMLRSLVTGRIRPK